MALLYKNYSIIPIKGWIRFGQAVSSKKGIYEPFSQEGIKLLTLDTCNNSTQPCSFGFKLSVLCAASSISLDERTHLPGW
jgi:hypothetical protein